MIVTTNSIQHDHEDDGAEEAAKCGFARSPHFETEEKKARIESAACVVTGHTIGTQWHHCIIPFHFARYFGRWELEFSQRNLVFLQQIHGSEIHRILGHLLFFQSFNPNLHSDIERYKGWTAERILCDNGFVKACKARPKSLRDMSINELCELKTYMDRLLPIDPKELTEFAKYKPKG